MASFRTRIARAFSRSRTVRLWNQRHVSICLLREDAALMMPSRKAILEEIVRMLFRMLDQLGCRIAEDSGEYGETADKEEEVEVEVEAEEA